MVMEVSRTHVFFERKNGREKREEMKGRKSGSAYFRARYSGVESDEGRRRRIGTRKGSMKEEGLPVETTSLFLSSMNQGKAR